MAGERQVQLEYSELMGKMLDEEARTAKAHKLLEVVYHFLGRDDLDGLTVGDVGCSAGFIAAALAAAGGTTLGFDIDEPGVAKAGARFGDRARFVLAAGDRLPLPDRSLDVIVFNHIYEHVVDPDAVVRELHRVLADDGVVYLGLANRLGVVEPHYRLPFLSYLPPGLADRYVRATGRGDQYHERLRTRGSLRRLFRDFTVWDYTYSLIREPERFAGEDIVPPAVRRLPSAAVRLVPVVPTFIWVATRSDLAPAGDPLRTPPSLVHRAAHPGRV
ncbi:MAG TPA: class I SAM-dependent methyltransferase [Acidimicrobiales bacterium]